MQGEIDSERTAEQRNKDGQFATPPKLARQITEYTLALAPAGRCPLRVLEPSCGSGAFLSAVIAAVETSGIAPQIVGVELDQRFAATARELWGTEARIDCGDFLTWASIEANGEFDLLVANPPYVRHHHLSPELKSAYNAIARTVTGQKVSKLTGLYVYFVLAAHPRLAGGAAASWLIPSEFMTVNYGAALRDFLTRPDVTLERIHLFDPQDAQFEDAIVTSCVVTYRNRPAPRGHHARLTFGGDVGEPHSERLVPVSELRVQPKWSRLFPQVKHQVALSATSLGDYFDVRRGIATGGNSFFIRARREFTDLGIDDEYLTPVLPSPRNLKATRVETDAHGWPQLDTPLALLNCTESDAAYLPEPVTQYLATAPREVRAGYLVGKRSPWYKQEQRPASPILCTYMGRGRSGEQPFRFIRNLSRATATNTYLMLFPKPSLIALATDLDVALDVVCDALRELTTGDLTHAGREYGGGLKKMEPKELASLPFDAVLDRLATRGLARPQTGRRVVQKKAEEEPLLLFV